LIPVLKKTYSTGVFNVELARCEKVFKKEFLCEIVKLIVFLKKKPRKKETFARS